MNLRASLRRGGASHLFSKLIFLAHKAPRAYFFRNGELSSANFRRAMTFFAKQYGWMQQRFLKRRIGRTLEIRLSVLREENKTRISKDFGDVTDFTARYWNNKECAVQRDECLCVRADVRIFDRC